MDRFAPITLGRALRVMESDSFVFTETAHPAGAVLAPHSHENSAISYVVAGRRTYTFGSTAIDCAPGAVVFVPAGARHASRFFGEPALGLMIELCQNDGDCADVFDEPTRSPHADLDRLCEMIRREMADGDDLTPLALESLALELLVRHGRSRPQCMPAWLGRVRDVLHGSLRNPRTLSALSSEAGVGRSRLTRTFRRYFRVSIGAYVRNLRTERAWQLVTASNTPLCEVASECGYADQSHLTRAFRRAFGASPGQLRSRDLSKAAHPIVPRPSKTS